jgi:hypothetical protein
MGSKSTVGHLGVELDDAREIAEKIDLCNCPGQSCRALPIASSAGFGGERTVAAQQSRL